MDRRPRGVRGVIGDVTVVLALGCRLRHVVLYTGPRRADDARALQHGATAETERRL